ncbi:hypothetical protein CEY00_Acc07542 [Actinidia chinensis var. chinensis]|uniref:Uncharacterized protein n=1 Tax=Actinidia chinensis var. chinensis TaxID=1590841 RepID=A0A2R6RCE8_ACTCC|nr:hypothetical protein CEY00_Acc07542 [Actinidia chinensis var. chinensis]
MWASSPLLSRPPPGVLQLSVAAARTAKPRDRVVASAVPNKFQRRSPSHNNDDHHNSAEDIGALGRTVLGALESNPQTKPLNPRSQNSNSSIKTSNSKEQEEEKRQLSGSDVLLALQRATAQKLKKKKKPRDYQTFLSTPKNRGPIEDEEDALDYSNARPICINSEWMTRLDELEKRLQELMDTTT